jgi:hypothetical protein
VNADLVVVAYVIADQSTEVLFTQDFHAKGVKRGHGADRSRPSGDKSGHQTGSNRWGNQVRQAKQSGNDERADSIIDNRFHGRANIVSPRPPIHHCTTLNLQQRRIAARLPGCATLPARETIAGQGGRSLSPAANPKSGIGKADVIA